MPSMMRRMRTRLPTYLSTGLGALVDISNTPWDYAGRTRQRILPQASVPSNLARTRRQDADSWSSELTETVASTFLLPGGSARPENAQCRRMRIAWSICQLRIFIRRVFRRRPQASGSSLRDPASKHEKQG